MSVDRPEPAPWVVLRRPECVEVPVLVEVPHAGLAVPDDLRAQLDVSDRTILNTSDIYVDELYAGTPERGATLLVSNLSRFVVDLNRAADDIDPAAVPAVPGALQRTYRGVVWRTAMTGECVLRRPLSVTEYRARVANYYTPYHDALRQEIERLRARFGQVVVLAAHSMPSEIASVGSSSTERPADVVPGSRGGTTASSAVLRAIETHFRRHRYSVTHDHPYRGGWTTAHYGAPQQGVHVVQVELNRALYVDESSCERIAGDFERLRNALTELIDTVAQAVATTQLAAE